jgi:amino acid adenylation domain-containing protein
MSHLGHTAATETTFPPLEWNDTDRDYSRNLCIHELFEIQAQRGGESVAVVFEGQQLAYQELNRRSNQLAHYLRKREVGPEVLVGLCVERSLDMIVGLLGILKAGGAYVPLDPAYPRERLAAILEDAKAPILVTQASLVDILPPHTAQVVRLDADWPKIAAESDTNPASNVKPENLSYVLFTSGSTGRPKGVAIQHSSAAMLIQWAQNVFLPEEIAGTLFSTSMCFDLSVFEMFVPLSMGGKIIVAQNALSLPKLPAAREVTLINTVPSAIAELVRMDAVPDSVQVVNLAGEALPTSLAQKIYEKTKARKVYNLYGPTEDTTYSTYALVPRKGEVTIGKPLPNTQVYILDANQQPTPIGVPGELHLAGDGLARGYFGRPDLTAERFLPNPFSSEPGERMYRTGDLARFLPDGNIQYLNRMDNQVKLRGFRIELGEIESVLSQHPSVESVVVIAREDKPGDKRLVAYIVPTGEVSRVDLCLFLKESLPEYMVPSLFTTIEALPLTPNGKVNRRALPPPDWSVVENTLPVDARDPLELMLLKSWRKVLGISKIGIRDNFFDLGGHSLLSARLLSEVEKIAGREIPLSALFRGATVESLAQIIREGSESLPEPLVMEIQPGTGGLAFFAVAPPGVESLGFALLARHMGPDQPVYKLQGSRVSPDVSTDDRPFTEEELRDLSAEYIAAMRAVQPEGPYCLGGMCEGVHIAERMVLDLEAQGQEVGVFAIFDTWVMQNSLRPWLWRMAYYRQRLQMLRTKTFADQIRAFKKAMQINLRSLLKSGKLAIRPEWQQLYWPQNFSPGRFRAPVILFKRPKQPFYYMQDPQMGWGQRSEGGVQVYEIDFNHHEILREPHIRILGEKLSAWVRKISEREAKSTHRNQRAETPSDTVLLSTRV